MKLLVENKHDKVCLNISLFVFGQMVCQIMIIFFYLVAACIQTLFTIIHYPYRSYLLS